MDIQTLKLFCCSESEKENLSQPYSSGEFTFATNGHMQIRVPRMQEVPERENAPRIEITQKDPVGMHYLKEPSEWVAVPAVAVVSEFCKHCGGTGKAIKCPECGGQGWVELETDWNQYPDQECITCKGTGQITEYRYDTMKSCRVYMPDRIDEECDQCNHGVIWPMVGEVINGVKINVRLLDLIGKLPGAQLGLFGELDVVRFRFDGGDGLVMPMRQQ